MLHLAATKAEGPQLVSLHDEHTDPRQDVRPEPGAINRFCILALDLGTTTGWALHGPQAHAESVEWRSIPDWPAYEASSDGRIRRSPVGRRSGRPRSSPTAQQETGYVSVCLCEHSRSKRVDVHRLVALAFHGRPPSASHLVAHNDGNRTNNTCTNLRWATQAENAGDCRAHGTALIGSRNPSTCITEIDVRAIRRMKAAGIPRPVIAAGYGLHKRSVFRILAKSS